MKGRTWLAVALVVIATILLIAGNLGVWFRNSILDSDNFTSEVSSVLREPEATDRASEVLAARATESGELQTRIQEALPRQGPLITALLDNELETVLQGTLARILQTDAFQNTLETAIREMHELLVSTLEGRRERLQIEDNQLVLDLKPAIDNLFQRLGMDVPQRLQAEDAGEVVLVNNARNLDRASTVVRAIDDATPFLLLFALLGYVGAVFTAANVSRGALMVGFGVLVAGLLSLLVWRLAGWGFSATLQDFTLARMILDGLIQSLRWQSFVLVLAGAGLVVVGDGRVISALSRWSGQSWQRASEFGGARVVVAVGLAVAVLLLLL